MVVDNLALMPDFLDPINLLSYFGTWALIGLLVVVFVESGVLFPILFDSVSRHTMEGHRVADAPAPCG